jgi:transposase
VRSQCTRAKTQARGLTIQVQCDYEALQKARERQKTKQFQQQYALRSGIEGTISQGVRANEAARFSLHWASENSSTAYSHSCCY